MASDLTKMIDLVIRDKGLDRQVLISTLEESVRAAAIKKFGLDYDLEVSFNEELGEIEVFEFKEVVEVVINENLQIYIEDAQKIDPECILGDSLGNKMETGTLGRIAAQSAKQVIMQRLKEVERDVIYDDFKDRRGEIVNGIVLRFNRGAIIVNLGKTEGELPAKEQVPNESYKQGDRIRAYVLDVKQFSRGPQIILSRTHPNFVSTLFENEVPEISEGIIRIVQVAREPGSRTKIAVSSKDADVDPVGACVGMKGRRVQAIVQELRGEKIDIVTWDPDAAKFICNALSPAEIVRVIVDEDHHSMEVVVPDDQLSLAIGKKGQNVRLAARLTSWRLDVIGENRYNQTLKEGYTSLLGIQGMPPQLAMNLYENGLRSAKDLSEEPISSLLSIDGMTEEIGEKLLENAKKSVKDAKNATSEPEEQDEDLENPDAEISDE